MTSLSASAAILEFTIMRNKYSQLTSRVQFYFGTYDDFFVAYLSDTSLCISLKETIAGGV